MEIRAEGDTLFLDGRELSTLDLFVSRALRIIGNHTPYVIVSGYIAILLGRTRSTEDIDILIPFSEPDAFIALHDDLLHQYEFINSEPASGLYSLLVSGSGIRLCEKDSFIPNIEIKFVIHESDAYSFEHRKRLLIQGKPFFISPFEIQIAYKLWLGSEKDLEDAIFIYEVTRDLIDEEVFLDFCNSFGVTYETP